MVLRGGWRTALKDEELRLYFGIMGVSVLLVTLNILPTFPTLWEGLYHGFFTVISIITSTAFSTVNFDLRPQFSRALLLILMISGAMAGSTGGGIKTARVLILLKSARAGLHRLLHPRSVKTVRMNGKAVEEEAVNAVYLFIVIYLAIALLAFLLISLDNMPLETNISAVLACLNNIGPGFGLVGPIANFSVYSGFSKVVLAMVMLLGRLEIFPVLLLFFPSTWRQ
jgi:trk system potassium uptake protein TrkH